MRSRILSLAALSLLALSSAVARAQESGAAVPAGAPAAAAVPAAPPEPQRPSDPAPARVAAEPTAKANPSAPAAAQAANPAGDRGHIDAALGFLKALSHSARKGDQGTAAWAEMKDFAGDKVPVTIAGAHHDIDLDAKSFDARLLQFSRIQTLRDGKEIKGVTVDLLDFKVGADEHKGKGTILMTRSGDGWKVTSIDAP